MTRLWRESEHRRDLEPDIAIAGFLIEHIKEAKEKPSYAKTIRAVNLEGLITNWKIYQSDMSSRLERLKLHGLVANTDNLNKVKIDFKKSDIVALREFRDELTKIARTLEEDDLSEIKSNVVSYGGMEINKKRRIVSYRGHLLHYSRGNKSITLLEKLMRSGGRLSFQEALEIRNPDELKKIKTRPRSKTTKELIKLTIKSDLDNLKKIAQAKLHLPDRFVTMSQTHQIVKLNLQN